MLLTRPIGKLHGFGQRLGCYQGSAGLLPALAERIENAATPVAPGRQRDRAAMAVRPGAAGNLAGFVFGGEPELEELRWCVLPGVAVVQCQCGDR